MIQLTINFSLLSASQPFGLYGAGAANGLIGAVSISKLGMNTIGNMVRWVDLSISRAGFGLEQGGFLKLDGMDRPTGRGGRYRFCGSVPLRH